MTTHLVVGGNGFLGRHLVRALLERGETVRIADAMPAHWFDAAAVDTHILDMSKASPGEFDALVDRIDTIYHCAWSTIPETANQDPALDLKINLGMTLGLLDALRRRGRGGRIVFLSSGGTVYGPLMRTPVPEDHPLDPITAYGISKLAAEKYLQLYRTLYGVDARVARIANPYGAGQNPSKPQGVIGTVVHRALSQKTIEIWGTGELVRDFIHVSDVVSALLLLAERPWKLGEAMPLFNFGSGVGCSINAVLTEVGASLGTELAIERVPGRAFDVPSSVLDITRARTILNWEPKVSLKSGVAQMIQDLKKDRSRSFSSW